ncbi:MAG TPA: PepSY-associated TM helix domain-containing protein [Bryobacteraceae bacterium]|nr:PepSY-associated TM helix domain-containing protein [Bryobacteraceae bacterium]
MPAGSWRYHPQRLWLRRALFQVHLWTGIAFGLYVLAISVSGSAIVFRNPLYKALSHGPLLVPVSGPRLTHQQLQQAALRAYPDYALSYIWDGKLPNQAVEIWLRRGNRQKQRLFDPFTGRDLGPSVPAGIKILAWLGDLHINLLAGERGRAINGVGAAILCIMSLSGLIVWWPGVVSWRRNLTIGWRANWKRLNWDLHSAVGVWMFPFVFMWGLTGVLLVFPRPYQNLVARFTPINQPFRRGRPMAIGDRILRWPAWLHFGNHWGWPIETLWTIFGLVPVLLFVTGVIMWWNRVVWPALRRLMRHSVNNIVPAGANPQR